MICDDVGYVLHSRPYRETSQLLTLFGYTQGRFNAVSRASRNRRSGNSLRPFVPLRLTWRGRTDLKSLSSAEPLNGGVFLAGSALYLGLYLNELLNRLLHEYEPHSDVFDLYRRTLEQLAAGVAAEPLLRQFELGLLEALGYGLQLDIAQDTGEPLDPAACYRFSPGEGLITARPGDSQGFSGQALLAVAKGDWADTETLKAAKRLTRLMLDTHLGGRPLQSRAFFREFLGSGRYGVPEE